LVLLLFTNIVKPPPPTSEVPAGQVAVAGPREETVVTFTTVAEVRLLEQMAKEVTLSVPGAWPEYPPVAVHDAGVVAPSASALPDESLGMSPSVTFPSFETRAPLPLVSSLPPETRVVPLGQVAVAKALLKWVVLVIAVVAVWMLIVWADAAGAYIKPSSEITPTTAVVRRRYTATSLRSDSARQESGRMLRS
jgi:hypothetical protein